MRQAYRPYFVIALVAYWCISTSTVVAAEPTALVTEGFDLAYNLDHEAAIAKLTSAVEVYPDNPIVHRSLAAAVWLKLIFSRGTLLVDNYLTGSVSRPTGDLEPPPVELDQLFEKHIERAIALSETEIRLAPDDANAHYELGIAVGLAASYRASIRGQTFRALRYAKRAYSAHQRVLELNPNRDDAKLLVGIYRYVVSIMPRLFRMMAYLVGFDGGKDEAIALVRDAAAYPGETQAEAQFALVLLLNRERQYGQAQRFLRQLRRTYPRNRLVWLETASTWLRDDRPAMADLSLVHGFSQLQGDDRTRMFGEDATWHLARGTARVDLGLVDRAHADLSRAANGDAPLWVTGRAQLGLGKLADLEGSRQRARDYYRQSKRLCDDARDRRCEQAADYYLDYPFTGS